MLRVVIRETMSADLVAKLVADILEVAESLMSACLLFLPFFDSDKADRL
jgi:hypothetical protein